MEALSLQRRHHRDDKKGLSKENNDFFFIVDSATKKGRLLHVDNRAHDISTPHSNGKE